MTALRAEARLPVDASTGNRARLRVMRYLLH